MPRFETDNKAIIAEASAAVRPIPVEQQIPQLLETFPEAANWVRENNVAGKTVGQMMDLRAAEGTPKDVQVWAGNLASSSAIAFGQGGNLSMLNSLGAKGNSKV